MIRVTYVLGSHDSRYSHVYKLQSVDSAQKLVDENMTKGRFSIEVVGGYIWIYPSKVSAIEIRDVTHDQRAQNAAKEGEN